VGPFFEADSIPLDKLLAGEDTARSFPDFLRPVSTALADIPALALTDTEAMQLTQGQAISLLTLMGRIPGDAGPTGLVRAMAGGGVIGLCRLEEGWLRPERIF
jgi:tRNA pseudouridine55 synthase